MKRPAPYCSGDMLKMLRNIDAGRPHGEGFAVCHYTAAELRSRGWMDRKHELTDAGRAYLKSRGDDVA